MEEVSGECNDAVCLEIIFRLKALVRARGEHKQKIQMNLLGNTVQLIDELTKVS